MSSSNLKYITALKSLDELIIADICNKSLQFLVDPVKFDFQEYLISLGKSSRLDLQDLKKIFHSLILFYQTVINEKLGPDFEKLAQELSLNKREIDILQNTWQKNVDDISISLLSKTISNNSLIDFDWNFGVTSSTNDSDYVGKTYLQLKLKFCDKNGCCKEEFIELTLDQFYQFLASMEKCRSYLDFIDSHKH